MAPPAPTSAPLQKSRRVIGTSSPSSRSSGLAGMARRWLTHHAVVVEMQAGELTVGVLRLNPDGAAGFARSTADLGHRVFKPIRQHDLCARLVACHLVAQR